jgi:hypothetical protein
MKDKCIFTILRDEPVFLSIWMNYYGKIFDIEDIYILHHESNNEFDDYIYRKYADDAIIESISYNETFDHEWLRSTVQNKQRELLKEYKTVVFAEIDEILWHPLSLDKFIDSLSSDVATCRGFEIVHHFGNEPDLDLSRKPLLQQRKWGYYAKLYNKTLISRIPLDWCHGFHNCPQQVKPSIDLHLIHLHKLDFKIAWDRNLSHKHTLLEKEVDISTMGVQNLRQKEEWLKYWWMLSVDDCLPDAKPDPVNHIPIPRYMKDAV